MSPRNTIFATSVLSAVLVLGVAAPAAYFGFELLEQRLEAGQIDLKSVVIELKSDALAEIKSVAAATASEAAAKQGDTENGPASSEVSAQLAALTVGMTALQKSVSELQTEQKNLAELMKLRTEGLITAATVAATPAPPLVRPGAREDTLNQTLYFSLGVYKGAKTDEKIAALIPKILEYSASGKCASNVMGFSDTLGGDKANLELSLKRAEHVASLLGAKQIPVGTVQGWGERWLDIHTVDGVKNDKNRRVVIETVCEAPVEKPIAKKPMGPVS